MIKVISFCLWGDDKKYCMGAVKNAELASQYYPGWECWYYVGDSVPSEYIEELKQHDHVKVFPMKWNDWRGMFVRFYPASDEHVEVFISRDCDSRLSQREADAVNEWLGEPKLVHGMQDHPWHMSRILLGGMCGFKRHACDDMIELINNHIDEYDPEWDCDQDFLQKYIYPIVKDKILLHSDFILLGNNFIGKGFPTDRDGLNFVGEIFDEYDRPNEEHRGILKSALS